AGSTLTVHGNGGFTARVQMGCFVMTPNSDIGCTLNNSSNPISGNLTGAAPSVNVALAITTVAPHAANLFPGFPLRWVGGTGWTLLASSIGLAYLLRNHRKPVLGLCVLALVAIGVACGGGSSTSGNNNGGGGGTTTGGTISGSY